MSDISIHLSPFEMILYSPVWGWPGLLVGGAAGALLWKKRRIAGGALGAIVGNFVVFVARLMTL